MSDPDIWRDKAAMPRARADEMDDVERRRVLLTLAEDCDQMAADLEVDGINTSARRPERCIAVSDRAESGGRKKMSSAGFLKRRHEPLDAGG
jgi:hypothetical protein